MTHLSHSNHRQPPLAPGLPLLGNTLGLLRDPLTLFARLYQEMGPVFVVRAPGREYTVLAGPKANRFFMRQGDDLQINRPVYKPYIDDLGTERVLIGMDGTHHHEYRKAMRPGFSRELISQQTERLIDKVVKGWHPEEAVNVTDLMQFLVGQLVGLTLAGCPLDQHFDEAVAFAHTYLGAGVGSFPEFMRYLPGYRQARSRFLGFLRGVLDWHRSQPVGADRQPDMIDLILGLDGLALSEEDLLANAHMPYTNSIVYVGAMAGFMLYELLKNPEVLEKVRQEADQLFSSEQLDSRQLRHSVWLYSTLLETERMHPIALSIPRLVEEGFELEGHWIKPGSVTLTATAVTHYLPEFFPDPYKFDPTRFQPPRSEHRQVGVLVPFGLGRHACLSAGIVEDVTMMIVARLVHLVEFLPIPDDHELKISVAPFPAPAKDFTVQALHHRSPEEQVASLQRLTALRIGAALPDLDHARLADIATEVEIRRFGAGSTIIRQGDPASEFYIILKGRVEVTKQDVQGETRTVAQLGEGQYFGEIGLLHGVPRTATVSTLSAVETIVLDRETFTAIIAETDLTSGEIADVVHRRIVSATLAVGLPQLDQDQIGGLSSQFEMLRYLPGDVILRQGDPPDRFYIIVRGRVEAMAIGLIGPNGSDIHLGTLGEGEYFGEIGLLQNRPRMATVRALPDGPVEVLALPRDAFEEMLAGSDQVGDELGMTMAERLIELIEHTENDNE